MTRKVFIKLMGLFVLLLVFQTVAMELILRRFVEHTAGKTLHLLDRESLWSGLIALAVALPLAAWAASGVTARLQRVVAFARRIAQGDLSARLEVSGARRTLGHGERAEPDRRTPGSELCRNRKPPARAGDHARLHAGGRGRDHRGRAGALVECRHAAHCRHPDSRRPPAGPLRTRSGTLGLHTRRAAGWRSAFRPRQFACAGSRCSRSVPRHLPSGGAMAVLHDVTRIEAAEKSRRDFIANVSHELRTPLTSIQGYVETLVEDPKPNPETTREFLGIIHKNASRMNRLTEDLLALASVESPDYKLAAAAHQSERTWCRMPSNRWAASLSIPTSNLVRPVRQTTR